MKKALAILILLAGVIGCYAEGWQVTVTTSSTPIAPAVGNPRMNADGTYSNLYTATDWAAGAVTAGAYLKSGGITYWAANAGTATNAPTHTWGAVATDGITYVAVNKRGKRSSLIVSLDDSSDTVYVNDNTAATTTAGTKLSAVLPGIEYGTFQGEVYAIASSGTVVVNVKQHQE